MPEDELDTPVVEEEESPTPSTGKGVQVNLEVTPKKGEGEKPPATPSLDPRRLDAIEKWVAGTRRTVEKIERSVLGLEHRLTQPVERPAPGGQVLPPGTPQETIDKYDQLVDQNRWQDAVRMLAREEARAEIEVQQQEQARQANAQAQLITVAQSKARVAHRYPTLHQETGDETSAEAKLFEEVYQQATQEDPLLLGDPHAPELLMYRMEDLAQARGVKLKPAVVSPTALTGRGSTGVRGGGLPPSRGAGGIRGNTVTLAPEQKEYCDYHGIPYEEYAKSLKALGETGEVAAP